VTDPRTSVMLKVAVDRVKQLVIGKRKIQLEPGKIIGAVIDAHQTETVDRIGEVLRKEIEAVVAVHHQVVVGLQIATRCPENHEMESEDVAVVQELHMEMVQIKRRVQDR
jgi:hypothetical protein